MPRYLVWAINFLTMNFSLRNKLFLSYVLVILITLSILSYLVDYQLNTQFQKFVLEITEGEFPLHPQDRGEIFLNAIQHSTVLTIIGAAIFAIAISFFITSYITKRVKSMIAATKAIAQGNYEERLPVESGDELGDLTRSLNSMAHSLEKNRYLQQQLITNVSHELATPLTSIGGYLEALTDEVIKEKGRKETYALMREEVDRLKNMLEEVRTLSLIEQPRFQVDRADSHVNELTQKILKSIKPQFDEKEVHLELKTDLKKDLFYLDKDRYTQILLNLLNNALKYSPKNKAVVVTLTENKGDLQVEVKDKGPGISPKDLPFIFERFYRADKSRNRKTGGLGVGLAIVKELVQAHGGKIEVESTPGEGCCFRLSFPG